MRQQQSARTTKLAKQKPQKKKSEEGVRRGSPLCSASSARMGIMVAVTKAPYRMAGMRIQFLRPAGRHASQGQAAAPRRLREMFL